MIFIFSQNKQNPNIPNKEKNIQNQPNTIFKNNINVNNNRSINPLGTIPMFSQMTEIMVHNKTNCASCGK